MSCDNIGTSYPVVVRILECAALLLPTYNNYYETITQGNYVTCYYETITQGNYVTC